MNTNVNMHIATFIPTGELIGIDKSDKGKNCHCKCYSCQGELVAKQGESNQWHFAHHKNSKKQCDYSFWVVCRDLAKQIFCSKISPIDSISLSYKIDNTTISRISIEDTRIDDITFDLSFYAKDIGRIFVYFLTPEYSRNQLESFDNFSENILLINLSSAINEKDNITAYLYKLIVEDINTKKFIERRKKISAQKSATNLFEEIEQEEKEQELALEILRNTPNLSHYRPDIFITTLSKPKFKIDTHKFSKKDRLYIHSLDKLFISFIQKYGYNSNKSFIYKEIFDDGKVYFISYNNTFLIYVILENKYVLIIPQNNTLEPIMTTSFRDSIARTINNFFPFEVFKSL